MDRTSMDLEIRGSVITETPAFMPSRLAAAMNLPPCEIVPGLESNRNIVDRINQCG